MIKVLVTDLDGTLFYPKNKFRMIPKKNLKVLRNFVDNGGTLVIASGRNNTFANKVINKINRPLVFLGCNSAIIYENKKITNEILLDNHELRSFLDDFNKRFSPTTNILMTDKDNCLMNPLKRKLITFLFYPIYNLFQGVYREPFQISKKRFNYQLDNAKIYKCMIMIGITKSAAAYAQVVNKYLMSNYPRFEFNWSSSSIEITAKGANKALGIKKYIESHGFKKSEVAVVGDSGNDIDMFKEYYENSFCMGHSFSTVKKYANNIIDNFSDIEKFLSNNSTK